MTPHEVICAECHFIVLSVAFSYCLASCRFAWRRHVECRGANVSVTALIRHKKSFVRLVPETI
jgi:hypothetical protein